MIPLACREEKPTHPPKDSRGSQKQCASRPVVALARLSRQGLAHIVGLEMIRVLAPGRRYELPAHHTAAGDRTRSREALQNRTVCISFSQGMSRWLRECALGGDTSKDSMRGEKCSHWCTCPPIMPFSKPLGAAWPGSNFGWAFYKDLRFRTVEWPKRRCCRRDVGVGSLHLVLILSEDP